MKHEDMSAAPKHSSSLLSFSVDTAHTGDRNNAPHVGHVDKVRADDKRCEHTAFVNRWAG